MNDYWEALERGADTVPEQWAAAHREATQGLGELEVVHRLHEAARMLDEDSHPGEADGEPPPSGRWERWKPALLPGAMLGPYRIERLLNHGGMGEVYVAEDTSMQRRVAVKVLPAHRVGDVAAWQRFQREVLALGRTSPHPNVATAFQAGEHEGRPYLVMELIPGMDLKQYVQQEGPLPIARACDLIRQAALGLRHLHVHGIVHRDVKPSNFQLTPEGTVKILDLGLARHTSPQDGGTDDSLTPSGAVLGTPGYLPPEQAWHPRDADVRSDLYSLGCTFYCLLTGGTPEREEPPPVRQRRPEVPKRLAGVVQRLMARDPADRYSSVDVFLRALDAATRSWWGTRWALISAAALVLLSAVGVGYGLRPQPVPQQPVAQPPSVPQQPLVQPFKGWIDIQVTETGNPQRQALRLWEPDARPLKVGDKVRVDAEVNRPAFLYVLWIDTTGKVWPVFPWTEGEWAEREPEEPIQKLSLPRNTPDWENKPGPPGMETLVLLVRTTPLPKEEDLKTRLADLGPQKWLDPLAVVWFENGAVVTGEAQRAPNLKQVQGASNPALRTQQLLQDRLQGLFEYTRAVSFGNQGG